MNRRPEACRMRRRSAHGGAAQANRNGALSPDGGRFYTIWLPLRPGIFVLPELYCVDVASKQVLKSIPMHGSGPLAVSPDGATAYVAGLDVNSVAPVLLIVDLATSQLAHVSFPGAYLALSADGARLYGTYQPELDEVAVMDTATLGISAIPLPAPAGPLALSSDGTRLYAAYTAFQSRIAVIDTAAKQVISSLPLSA